LQFLALILIAKNSFVKGEWAKCGSRLFTFEQTYCQLSRSVLLWTGVINMTEFERLRVQAGLTISQVAQEARISRATVENIEKGRRVRAPLAQRACNVLGKYLGREISYQDLGIPVVR
jgi:DNA-binding XRE family transcriptional regulator